MITSASTFSVPENVSTVGTLSGSDDDNDSLTYTLEETDDVELFTLNPDTGDLSFKEPPDFENPRDADFNNDYNLTVKVDDGNDFVTQDITITVTDDLAEIVVSAPQGTVSEAGTAASFTVQLASAPTSDVFIPVSSSDDSEGTIDVSMLVFTSTNWNIAQTVTVSGVQDYVNDGDQSFNAVLGAASSSDAAYNGLTAADVTLLNIEVPNLAPDITMPAAQSLDEDSSITLSVANNNAISISDIDADSNGSTASLELSLSVNQGTMSLSQTTGLSFSTGTGTDDQSLVATGTAAALNAALDGLVYTSTENYNGAETLVIAVNDQGNTGTGGAQTTTASLALTINPANDAPQFATTAPTVATENSDYFYGLSTSDIDGGDKLSITAPALPQWLTLTDQGDGTAVLSGTPTNADVGSHSVELLVSDAGGLNSTQQFTIVVANTAPVITSDNTYSVPENTANITTLTSTDDGPRTTYAIASGDDGPLFSVDVRTGTLAFISAPDFETPGDNNADNTYTLTVQVDDGNGAPDSTASQVINISITDLDETDVGNVRDSDNAADELEENSAGGAAVGITASATDADATNNAITYTLIDNADGRFTIDSATGVVTVSNAPEATETTQLDFETSQTHSIVIRAISEDGSSSDVEKQIAIIDINEPPRIVNNNSASSDAVVVEENQTLANSFNASDVDENSIVTYSITGGADRDAFSIEPGTGQLTFVDAPDFEEKATYSVVITASDNGRPSLTDTQTVTIRISDVAEAPALITTEFVSSEGFTGNIGLLDIFDPDINDIVSLQVVGGSAQSTIVYSEETGELVQVEPIAEGIYTLDIILTDSTNNSTSATLTISVRNDPALAAANTDTTSTTDNIDTVDFISTVESANLMAVNSSTVEENETQTQMQPTLIESAKDSTTLMASVSETESSLSATDLYAQAVRDKVITLLTVEFDDSNASSSLEDSGEVTTDRSRIISLLSRLADEGASIDIPSSGEFQISRSLLSLTPYSASSSSGTLEEELKRTTDQENARHQLILAVSGGAVAIVTTGFVAWLLSTGVMLSAASTSSALWRNFDPIPVLDGRDDNTSSK